MNAKIALPVAREEFGFSRTTCGCKKCQAWCRHQPGALVPSDLDRLIPQGEDPFLWAEEHLRASPGLVIPLGELVVSIPTLVPAKQANGHCHWLKDGRCQVHADSPYGCAFLDQHLFNREAARRNHAARLARAEAFQKNSLYSQIWQHLHAKVLTYSTGQADHSSVGKAIRKINEWAANRKAKEVWKKLRRLRRRAA